MVDDERILELARFTPEGKLTPGFGSHYVFLVGRDDVHGILRHLIQREQFEFDFNQYGYADDEINADIMKLVQNPEVVVQGTLDRSQAGGVHERNLLAMDEARDPEGFSNSIAIGQSATHQISHTKAGVLVGQGIAFEGSTNWSVSGEGAGISLKLGAQPKGWKAQNNTLVVTTNPVVIGRLRTQLAIEHRIALAQEQQRKAKEQL
ncbi:hypothetical protein AHiyo8_59470 [Arthrobacter sp. Hiyo8]|uniref:hypothetical protein n=1 Tax=Arthrobacter sp. Hiyo1 TaxID=1588020 RepID=UPI000683873D|nr:hypothetical protein [Arthrobacter sp. Hiyo1]BAS17644.1 hypothetical protein AHiyo8_59470 [Arthrobacter sp. Hiyo8]GAP58000.1 hypothetical protein AHiyo1_09620 [Arthrobacter sp. Hiyo1]